MDTGIGATLREAREDQGRSIDDVALALRARVTQLRDLEEERFDTFGGDVYAKGFLKSYAIELGLDPTPLLETYRREVTSDDGHPGALASSGMARPRRTAQRRGAPPGWVAALVVAVIVVAVISFVGSLGPGTTPEVADDAMEDMPPTSASPDEDEASDDPGASGDDADDPDQAADDEPAGEDDADEGDAEADDDANDDADAEDETEAEEPDGVELVLEYEGASWTRVTVDGSTVLEETVPEGEILPFEAEEEIVARFGNAGGVRVQLNGEDLGAQGGQGDVVDVVFTPDGAETE